MCLRRELWARGLRYRANVKEIIGKPDIVFPTQKVLIFCDGDFFHGRDWPTLRDKLARRANSSYWIKKIEYNRQRDREVDAELKRAGWRVLRFWESEIKSDLEQAARDVESALQNTGS
jgi:DNA mismatch endonuclease (patch repair protein)